MGKLVVLVTVICSVVNSTWPLNQNKSELLNVDCDLQLQLVFEIFDDDER